MDLLVADPMAAGTRGEVYWVTGRSAYGKNEVILLSMHKDLRLTVRGAAVGEALGSRLAAGRLVQGSKNMALGLVGAPAAGGSGKAGAGRLYGIMPAF